MSWQRILASLNLESVRTILVFKNNSYDIPDFGGALYFT